MGETQQAVADGLLFSIIMPAYNEQDVIADTVDALCTHLNGASHRYEVIIVDDASSDDTANIIAELAQRHNAVRGLHNGGPNGYGHAIRRGLDVYKGDAAVVVTSDGADLPKDVVAYFDKITEGYDCAFGERFGPGSTVTGYPPVKKVINRLANRLLGWVAGGRGYRDFTNGFKCYRRHVIDDMQPLEAGQFNITIEMSLKAVLAGHSFAVVPNDWQQRDAGQSSFNVARLIKPYFATMIFCLARNYLRGIKR